MVGARLDDCQTNLTVFNVKVKLHLWGGIKAVRDSFFGGKETSRSVRLSRGEIF